jgi:hypothetical protein
MNGFKMKIMKIKEDNSPSTMLNSHKLFRRDTNIVFRLLKHQKKNLDIQSLFYLAGVRG